MISCFDWSLSECLNLERHISFAVVTEKKVLRYFGAICEIKREKSKTNDVSKDTSRAHSALEVCLLLSSSASSLLLEYKYTAMKLISCDIKSPVTHATPPTSFGSEKER